MFEPMDFFFFFFGLLQQNQNFSTKMAAYAITFPYTTFLLAETTYLYKV